MEMAVKYQQKVQSDLKNPQKLGQFKDILKQYIRKNNLHSSEKAPLYKDALKSELKKLIELLWTEEGFNQYMCGSKRVKKSSLYQEMRKKLLEYAPKHAETQQVQSSNKQSNCELKSRKSVWSNSQSSNSLGGSTRGFKFGGSPKGLKILTETPAPNYYCPKNKVFEKHQPSANIGSARRIEFLNISGNSPGPAYYQPNDDFISKQHS